MDREQQVEHVARAFYCVEHDEQSWGLAPEDLKHEFRKLACDAIAMVELCHEGTIDQLPRESMHVRESISA